jgi:hypothetical protein
MSRRRLRRRIKRQMRDRPIQPRLAAALQSLAECQLQSQTSRSAALDTAAAGVMSVDAAIAASVLAIRSAHHLWVAALTLLVFSLAVSASALIIASANDIGPTVEAIIVNRDRRSASDLEHRLLDDLARRVTANQQALARKEPRLLSALATMLLAIFVELAGQIH